MPAAHISHRKLLSSTIEPAGQDSQAFALVLGTVSPVHAIHEPLTKMAPSWHVMQVFCCELGFCPSGHGLHKTQSSVICPDGHWEHAVCSELEIVPAGQTSHELAAVLAKVPSEHASHCVLSLLAMYPAGHAVQDISSAMEISPPGQETHELVPGL